MEGNRSTAATTNGDVSVVDVAVHALKERGILEPEALVAIAGHEGTLGACRWYDAQNGRVGTGMLVTVLRGGGKPGWQANQSRDLMAEQERYRASICAWLSKHFPEFDRPVFGPHPAAYVAVLHLHQQYGKGALTKREHGPEIRAAVERWEAKWES